MKKLLKWSTISLAVATGVVIALELAAAARRRVDRGLHQMERVADEARQAMAKTEEALAHTESAIRNVRRTVS